MMQYIFDFLSVLFDKLKEREKIESIFLFGSFARGNFRKNSDIDLFIDVEDKNKEEVSKIVHESVNEFELKAEKSWKLKGINNPIAPIVDNINAVRWKELKKEIASYGLTLYGRYYAEEQKNKNYILLSYDASKLKQKEKMKVIRKLFGYKLKKRKKVYSQKGLLEELNAKKLSNTILVNIENYKKILDFLRQNKVYTKISEIWLE